MPRVSGVSGSSTVWRILRNPIPITVSPCVLLKPIGLRSSVTFNVFAADLAAFATFATFDLALPMTFDL